MKIVAIGPRVDQGVDRWVAFLHFEREGVPEVVMLKPVSSYAEAEDRSRANDADGVLVSPEVMREMIQAGVGPSV